MSAIAVVLGDRRVITGKHGNVYSCRCFPTIVVACGVGESILTIKIRIWDVGHIRSVIFNCAIFGLSH